MKLCLVKTIKISGRRGNSANSKYRPDTIKMALKDDKGKNYQICVRIGEQVMQSQRWIVGEDRVEIEPFEAANGMVGIRLKRSASPAAKMLSANAKSRGKMHTATIRFTCPESTELLKDCWGKETVPFEQDGWLYAAWDVK